MSDSPGDTSASGLALPLGECGRHSHPADERSRGGERALRATTPQTSRVAAGSDRPAHTQLALMVLPSVSGRRR
jgi:hypothetical protein